MPTVIVGSVQQFASDNYGDNRGQERYDGSCDNFMPACGQAIGADQADSRYQPAYEDMPFPGGILLLGLNQREFEMALVNRVDVQQG